jgi:hypothetical protein
MDSGIGPTAPRLHGRFLSERGDQIDVHILEMNGESYRLATSKKAQRRSAQGAKPKAENAKRRRPRHRNINRHGSTKINRASQPFSSLNPTGTLSRRPLAHFVSAIDTSANLTSQRTRRCTGLADAIPRCEFPASRRGVRDLCANSSGRYGWLVILLPCNALEDSPCLVGGLQLGL